MKLVRVIRDVRDCRRDYYLDAGEARRLYKAGRLGWDEVNKAYCE